VAVLAPLAQAVAQPAPAHFHTRWTVEDGLPQNSVSALLQARDGYLWLGTLGGLVRFDGVRFTVYTVGPHARAREQPHPGARAGRDRPDLDWHGIRRPQRLRRGTDRAVYPERSSSLAPIQALHAAADGRLWVGTSGGVAVADGTTLAVLTAADGLAGDNVHAFAEAPDGR
jgi:ligand-binding sensor domain-containing protein